MYDRCGVPRPIGAYVKRASAVVLIALAIAWALSGCGGKAQPAPSESPVPPPGVSHPFQDALMGHGFSLKTMKITNENTATVDPPPDAGHCTVVIQASMTSLSDYKVVSVAGTPLAQLPPVLQSMINGVNIDADTLWKAIEGQRGLGAIHC